MAEVVGLCPSTVPLELRQVCVCFFLLLFFGSLAGGDQGPCYDGYSGLEQVEKGNVKIILLLQWPFELHVAG